MHVLFLFDIDGTLIDMTPAHVKAYQHAYKKVTGITVSKKFLIRQFGNTERRIQEAVFKHHNIPDKGRIDKVTNIYISTLAKSFKTANVKVLPGVKRLIKRLKENKQPLGIVTGNTKRIGKPILKRIKLYDYFDIFSYGHANKRAHIVRKAIKMAKERKLQFERVVVIGDSPFDVHAAKENKVVSVVVATGRYKMRELKKEKPDLLLRTLKDYKKILKKADL